MSANEEMNDCLASRGAVWVSTDDETGEGYEQEVGPGCAWETIGVKEDRCLTCGRTYVYP